jgi:hypothetical protein
MKIYPYIKLMLFVVSTSPLLLFAQVEKEIAPPYHIKTITFVQSGQNQVPIFKLGDSFQLEFDDLYGDEANYYYTITHCDYDWKPSQLAINEYILGFDNQRIIDYENSFNTLQMYSHYRLPFPNQFTKRFKVSGNYVIKILNDNRDIVFSKKFILYEDIVAVPLQVKNPRDVEVLQKKHNLEFSVIPPESMLLQDPIRNIKIMLLQNGIFHTAIHNVKPMFTIGNELKYKYDRETQFWAGNEFLFFDNKDIRNAINNVASVSSKGGVYNTFLMRNMARKNISYTFAPDVNGNFVVRNIFAQQAEVEADYSWVFFELEANEYAGKESIYIVGMFNNYALNDESKMDWNEKKGLYEKAIMIKQGFTNYGFLLADDQGKINQEDAIDGNFFQTENNYQAIVYYRGNNDRYDRVVGKGMASSVDIIN